MDRIFNHYDPSPTFNPHKLDPDSDSRVSHLFVEQFPVASKYVRNANVK